MQAAEPKRESSPQASNGTTQGRKVTAASAKSAPAKRRRSPSPLPPAGKKLKVSTAETAAEQAVPGATKEKKGKAVAVNAAAEPASNKKTKTIPAAAVQKTPDRLEEEVPAEVVAATGKQVKAVGRPPAAARTTAAKKKAKGEEEEEVGPSPRKRGRLEPETASPAENSSVPPQDKKGGMRGRGTEEVVSPGVAANRKKGAQQKKPGKEEDEKPTAQSEEKLASVAPSPSVEKAAGRGRKAGKGKATTAPTTPAKKKGIGAASPVPESLPAPARGKKGAKKGAGEASPMEASSPSVSLPSNKKMGKAAFSEQAKKGRKQPETPVSDEPAEAVPAAEAAPTPTPVKKKGGKKAASSPVKIPPPPPAAAKKGASKAAAKAAELLVEPPVAGKKKPAAAKSTEGTKTVGTACSAAAASKSKSSGKNAHQRVPSPVSLPVKRGRR